MIKTNQNHSDNKKIRKPFIYSEFVDWTAFPMAPRNGVLIETQEEFAQVYGVSKDTLSLWKQRADFEEQVNRKLKSWSIGKDMSVYQAIYNSALKGNAKSQKLWLEYFKGFHLKKIKKEKPVREVTEDDIRNLIQSLPDLLQIKYNTFLEELVRDSIANDNGDEYHIEKSMREYKKYKELKVLAEEKEIKDTGL